ncbi:unnamed protein product [Effrenium voratum]|nr:unnamed protein product [Effrenium voratum]
MASIPESSAVFLERCAAVGLGESETTILQNAGITAKLAFSVGQLGETPSTDDLKGLIREGDEAVSVGQLSCIRRLVFEAQTIMIAQVKSLVENKPEGSLQLAPAERSERIKKQVERLKGLTLKGELECAHSCYDQDKPRREIILVSGSQLQALTRRGLAMDLMQLATYAVVEEYNSMLLNHLQSHAIPGYNKVTLQQVLKADQQAWVRLAETLTSGVKRAADGSLPMDAAIQALANDPKFTFYLLPLPLASQKRSLEDAAERPAKIVTSMQKGKGSADKGGGKGKKTRAWRQPKGMPQELTSKQSSTKSGQPICWAFNLACGCSKAKAGQECPRGLHVCMEPGCQKNHSLVEHR